MPIFLFSAHFLENFMSKDKYCKGYNTWTQLISMVFCQFSQCDTVRDLSNDKGGENYIVLCNVIRHRTIDHAQNLLRTILVLTT